MKNYVKRTAVLLMAGLMLLAGIAVPCRRAEAAMMYNNTASASLSCNVDSSGNLSASLNVTGIKNKTTRIKAELYVEKRILGLLWKKADIGYNDNVWIDSVTGHIYNNVFSTVLSSNGTYRVTVTFTVSGTGGADDIITKTETITY